MEYVTLGKTGLRISRLGFGGIPIQRLDAAGAMALVDKLCEKEINFIDTAIGYTVSEELLGQALEGRRDKFVLASKAKSYDRASMARDIDISLKRLRTDHIELYQIHNAKVEHLEQVMAPGGALEALMEAKAAGKIGHIGVTAHTMEAFALAVEQDWVETIMFPYNIVESQGEALMARAAEKNIAIIAMKPLAGGSIEDATLAMRYICANPNVTVVIPGMFSPAEVEQNAAAVSDTGPLTAEELEKAEAIRRQLGTQFCRRCNYCAPCTVGIDIPTTFILDGYLQRYSLGDWARGTYSGMVKASKCVECGVCETRCPYDLPIRQMLKKVAADFGE